MYLCTRVRMCVCVRVYVRAKDECADVLQNWCTEKCLQESSGTPGVLVTQLTSTADHRLCVYNLCVACLSSRPHYLWH